MRSCCLPFLITVTCASLEVPRVVKTSWPRDGIVERRAVDGEHEVTRPQADTGKRLAVATGVNAEAPLLALSKHRLRTDDLRRSRSARWQ